MVLLACGLARAVQEKTRCIEWVCIYAYIHPHLYNDINVLLHKSSSSGALLGAWLCRPTWGPVYAWLCTFLHDDPHMVISTCRAKLLNYWLV